MSLLDERTLLRICPVSATLAYIAHRQDRPGPFFATTRNTPVTKIRLTLSSLGLPQNDYAGHSFRIGAATTAALAGIEDSTIQAMGRWQSAAFLQYIRIPREQLAALSRQMATVIYCTCSLPSPPGRWRADLHIATLTSCIPITLICYTCSILYTFHLGFGGSTS